MGCFFRTVSVPSEIYRSPREKRGKSNFRDMHPEWQMPRKLGEVAISLGEGQKCVQWSAGADTIESRNDKELSPLASSSPAILPLIFLPFILPPGSTKHAISHGLSSIFLTLLGF
jgi:hypothetical protein